MHGLVDGPHPLESVYEALRAGGYDEVIVSTLSRRFSRWLHRDLPGRIRAMGFPVTVVARRPPSTTAARVFTSDRARRRVGSGARGWRRESTVRAAQRIASAEGVPLRAVDAPAQ